MKRHLVTGGLGFIGSAIVKKLLNYKDNIVYIVDDMSNPSCTVEDLSSNTRRLMAPLVEIYDWDDDSKSPNVVCIEGDCAHKTIINAIGNGEFDTVFHLAAKPRVQWSVEHPTESTMENFTKTIQLAKASATGHTKFIFSSTGAVYGDSVAMPTKEDSFKKPQNPYGLAKLCAEQYLQVYEELYDLDWVALRYFNVYGHGQWGSSPYCTAIAAWCYRVKNDLPMRFDGDGEQSRDMVYVDDVAEANIIISQQHHRLMKNRIYNIGTGTSYTNNEILSHFIEKGYNNIQNAPERLGDVKHTLANNIRMREDFNWSPSIKLKDGLEKTFNWWEI